MDLSKMLLTAKDVSSLLSLSRAKTYLLFHRVDFPTIRIDGNLRVGSQDLINWVEQQKITKE